MGIEKRDRSGIEEGIYARLQSFPVIPYGNTPEISMS
jgi:hypothetical protein